VKEIRVSFKNLEYINQRGMEGIRRHIDYCLPDNKVYGQAEIYLRRENNKYAELLPINLLKS
jgi:hypothetical protein